MQHSAQTEGAFHSTWRYTAAEGFPALLTRSAAQVLVVEIELRNGDGSPITSGDGIFVQVEVNSTQEIRWTNSGAEGGESIDGNPRAIATFVGGSRWRAPCGRGG